MAEPMESEKSALQKDKFTKMIRSWIDQFAHVLQSTDTKEFIQVLVIDPFLKNIMGQIFPYILIGFCLFAAVFIFVILTFVIILFRPSAAAVATAATVAAVAATAPANVSCPFCHITSAAVNAIPK
jgi:CBS domain containing-hemolysin-like protein